MRRLVPVLAVLLSLSPLWGQHAVDPTQGMHRLICLVHLTGSGTVADPRRPEYVPGPGAAASRDGIIAWAFQPTDDGQMAIVHLVAVNRAALAAPLADARPEVRIFEIGRDKPAAIEAELRKYKSGFTLESLKVIAR